MGMDRPGNIDASQAPALALEAIRIAEESARAAERSAAGALATIEHAESSLKASEQRMVEITAAASSAASEATEARLRATEVATEFRALEQRVANALRFAVGPGGRKADPAPAPAAPAPTPASEIPPGWSPAAVPAPVRKQGGTTAEFEALWDSFDRKADRIVERLKALEARTTDVIQAPMPGSTGRSLRRERQ